MDKELRLLLGTLTEQGYTVKRTKRGHYTVRAADGTYVTTLAGTPSDHRSRKNARADIARHQRTQQGE